MGRNALDAVIHSADIYNLVPNTCGTEAAGAGGGARAGTVAPAVGTLPNGCCCAADLQY